MASKDYSWLFFIGFILLGIAAIVIGATRGIATSVTMGAATVVVGIVTWITGATATPSGLDGGGAGIVISRVRWYVWLGCVALYGVAFAIGHAIGK
jgi:hypothetical membrane protein